MLNLKNLTLFCVLAFTTSACTQKEEQPLSQDGLDDFSVCVDNDAIKKGLRVDYAFFKENSDLLSRIENAISPKSPLNKLLDSFTHCIEEHNILLPTDQKDRALESTRQLAARGATPQQIETFAKGLR